MKNLQKCIFVRMVLIVRKGQNRQKRSDMSKLVRIVKIVQNCQKCQNWSKYMTWCVIEDLLVSHRVDSISRPVSLPYPEIINRLCSIIGQRLSKFVTTIKIGQKLLRARISRARIVNNVQIFNFQNYQIYQYCQKRLKTK